MYGQRKVCGPSRRCLTSCTPRKRVPVYDASLVVGTMTRVREVVRSPVGVGRSL